MLGGWLTEVELLVRPIASVPVHPRSARHEGFLRKPPVEVLK
jgi:hypothetical protein